jgi:hypothetical protein
MHEIIAKVAKYVDDRTLAALYAASPSITSLTLPRLRTVAQYARMRQCLRDIAQIQHKDEHTRVCCGTTIHACTLIYGKPRRRTDISHCVTDETRSRGSRIYTRWWGAQLVAVQHTRLKVWLFGAKRTKSMQVQKVVVCQIETGGIAKSITLHEFLVDCAAVEALYASGL